MRTIKFRGKRIDNCEWVYGYLYELPLESGNVCMILTTDNIHKDNSIEPQYHLAFTLWKDLFVVDSSTVGQYTGLKDKNGKEIYEGDILAYKGIKQTYYYKVWWNPKRYTFYIGNSPIDAYGIKDECQLELSGNIHDNPELINK